MIGPLTQLLAGSGLFAGLALIGIVLARGRVGWSWLAIGFGLFILHDMAMSLGWGMAGPWLVRAIPFPAGAGLSILMLTALGLILFRHDWKVTGLTMPLCGPAPVRAIAVALLVSGGLAAAAYLSPGISPLPAGEIALQAGLPALADEIFYRGLLFGALAQAFSGKPRVLGVPFGWGAAMSAILFAAAYAVTLTPGLAVLIDAQAAAIFLIAGLVLAWLRAASGSIFLPFAVHLWASVVFYLV